MQTRGCLLLVGVLSIVPSAWAQSMNVNFAGPLVTSPNASYSAAGLAGDWNVIEGVNGVTYFDLMRLDGAASPARVKNIGGLQLLTHNHAGTSGNDQDLLDHYLATFDPGLEVCLFFNDLQDGLYEIISYAWLPDQAAIDSYVTVDYSSDPPAFVGGVWRGSHEEGLTYAVHQVQVAGGLLYSHSGIPPASGYVKAGLNGVQLRKISLTTPQDVDGDEDVDLADYAAFEDCAEGPGKLGWRPHCPAFDLDDDNDVDLADFAHFQTSFDE